MYQTCKASEYTTITANGYINTHCMKLSLNILCYISTYNNISIYARVPVKSDNILSSSDEFFIFFLKTNITWVFNGIGSADSIEYPHYVLIEE